MKIPLLTNVERTANGNIAYRPIGKRGNRLVTSVVVLKRNADGDLEFDYSNNAVEAV